MVGGIRCWPTGVLAECQGVKIGLATYLVALIRKDDLMAQHHSKLLLLPPLPKYIFVGHNVAAGLALNTPWGGRQGAPDAAHGPEFRNWCSRETVCSNELSTFLPPLTLRSRRRLQTI